MLLGKRPRPPMRRTTSMTGITVDVPDDETNHPEEPPQHGNFLPPNNHHLHNINISSGLDHDHQRFLATMMVSPRTHHRTSSIDHQFAETAHFLTTCGLCKRRLAPGRDIYMYRGDTAFCSLECREKQMKQDERKERCFNNNGVIAPSKKEERAPSTTSASSSSTTTAKASSTKTQTVAAA